MKDEILTRKQLYDLVWSTPLLTLSKKYDISDSGLRKICLRYQIPQPRAGHWQKIAHDKKVRVKDFIEKKNDLDKVILRLRDPNVEKLKQSKASEVSYPEVDFHVPEKLTDPDKLVILSEKLLRESERNWHKRNPEYNGLINCREGLSILVSRQTIDRALIFMDSLVKILKSRGYSVESDRETYVLIANQKIKISLREKTTRREFLNNYNWNTYEHTPNGLLCLKADIWPGKEWTDGKIPIEKQLPAILRKLEDTAEQMRLDEIDRKKRGIEQEKKEKLKKEREALEDNELRDFRDLMAQAMRWSQMTMLRNYIRDMESIARSKGAFDASMNEWITWAKEKADWFDPSINREDDLMVNVDKHSLTTKREDYRSYFSFQDAERSNEDNFWKSHWWNKK